MRLGRADERPPGYGIFFLAAPSNPELDDTSTCDPHFLVLVLLIYVMVGRDLERGKKFLW